ncbi:MAG TPA: aminopeptidase P N-terminal domain-containing protein [Flavisolibacter sp.]|jgi:Xaa-Pro aminopeptidase|nr:aminopeptidase P N-terminal domain-containing protein [Flavisolibacter sp.]
MQLRPLLLTIFLCFTGTIILAQDFLPKDYLTASFHSGRREAARAQMPANSVMVVFAAPTRTFANDVEYLYHQNPDLYYFTGYKEPHAVLLIFKEDQKAADGTTYKELFFIQKKNPQREQWTGKRLGIEGARERSGIAAVFNGEDFEKTAIDFSRFDKIIMDQFPDGIEGTSNDPANLGNLLKTFIAKAGLKDYDPAVDGNLNAISQFAYFSNLSQIKQMVRNREKDHPAVLANPLLTEFFSIEDSVSLDAFKAKLTKQRVSTALFRQITAGLREIKTPEEMYLIRKAVEISCQGHNEVMKAVRPDMSELEIQGLHEYIHKRYGSEEVGYGSIVGAGENGCTLHYMENSKTRVGTDMLLMDVGAEYHGYTADVTRTIPVNGKFSPEARQIYQLVYDAQEAAFNILKEGAKFADASKAAKDVIANGLVKLGIIKDVKDVNKYYPHGLSHHIGLDVHDKGSYSTLKKDMVITIEPGIYIPSNSPCDKKWWGLSVRIEDDALITEKGYELLTSFAPRSIEGVEKMVAEKSALDNYKVPALQTVPKKSF